MMLKSNSIAVSFLAFSVILAATGGSVFAEDGIWVDRSQVFHLPKSGPGEPFLIRRHKVSAWNGQEEPDLEFTWEPRNPPGVDSEGRITGHGELTWRLAGTPSYDDTNRYSVYSGELREGKRHGHGRFQRQDGTLYIGEWKDDLFDGEGKLTSANGDYYVGSFRNGAFDGYGEHTLHSGEVYKGAFREGARHGDARILTAEGTLLETRWREGTQVFVRTIATAAPGSAPEIRLVAGQNTGDAEKVAIGLSINQELNLQYKNSGGIGYFHQVNNQSIEVFPEDDSYANHWKGTATVNPYFSQSSNSVFMNISFKGNGGHKFQMKEIVFDVAESAPFNKPMLEVGRNTGCVGFRPDFHFLNYGWGKVESASIEFVFGNEDGSRKSDKVFKVGLREFDKGTNVIIRKAVAEMGADVAALDKQTLPSCPSLDHIESCMKSGIPNIPAGELTQYIYPEWINANVKLHGKITYQWSDHTGAKKSASEPFSTAVTLAEQTFVQSAAECSDLPFMQPEAPKLFKVKLPSNKKNYNLTFPIKVPRESMIGGTLDLSADRSSVHKMRVGAKFADGSKKMSKPVNLYFFKPRSFYREDVDFGEEIKLPMCNPNLYSSC